MLSTLTTWGLIAGTASLAIMATIFVVVMRNSSSSRQITGWKKTALHPSGYLRFAGVAYAVAGVSFLLSKMF